jgi:hypothetical protein
MHRECVRGLGLRDRKRHNKQAFLEFHRLVEIIRKPFTKQNILVL